MKDLLETIKGSVEDYYHVLYSIEEHEVQSICTTCLHSDNCVYKGEGNRTITSCDEFESVRGASAAEMKPTTGYIRKKAGPYKGLCANCEHSRNCQYAVTETGIWYCEEYK